MLSQFEMLLTLIGYTTVRILLPLAFLFALERLYNHRFARK